MSPSGRPGEFDLIGRYFRPLAGEGAFDLADDAALLQSAPGFEFVITKDLVVEGVHFFPGDPPESIAAKALGVNLSDLAAKGAQPFGYLLGLGLADGWTEDWVAAFASRLGADQQRYGITLLGGDTTRAGARAVISITALGRVPSGMMVHRSGARPGDVVVVTGTIGDAALAAAIRYGTIAGAGGTTGHLMDRYLHPRPRVAAAAAVRDHAHAAMDVSDGLVGDLAHICRASGVGAVIEAGRVPLSAEAAALAADSPAALAIILTGGDDYEILAAIAPDRLDAFTAACQAQGVAATAIGAIVAEPGPPAVRDRDGANMVLARRSWDHFAARG